jgi:protein O-GlcNAc transferase
MGKKSDFRHGRNRTGRGQPKLSSNLPPTREAQLTSAFGQALAHHRAGRLADAKQMYRQIVKAQPGHFESRHLLGVVCHQLGDHVEAVRQIDVALTINPRAASAYINRGVVLQHLKRFDEALASYDQAIGLEPDDADNFYNRGNALKELKRLDEAVESYDRAIALNPDHTGALYNRGNALGELKRCAEALASYERVISLTPRHTEAHVNRGIVLAELGRFDEALASFDQAIAVSPGHPGAWINRGMTLHGLERLDEALTSFDRAIEFNPNFAEACNRRGNTLHRSKRLDAAVASYDRAIAIMPDYAEAFSNRGNALRELRRFEEALASCDRAIALEPNLAEAYVNRGIALMDMMRFDDALASCDRALNVRPDYAEALSARAAILQAQGKIDDAIATYRHALSIKPDDAAIHTNLIFALNFDASASEADKQSERVRWNKRHAQQFAQNIGPHTNDRDPFRRLRIGYVTDRFRRQAAAYSFGGVLHCQDPEQFEVFCYSDTLQEDDVTARFRNRADQWRNTGGLSHDKLAELIRQDKIDILVDLVGHMAGHRLHVFARKPAPIQLTAWGEPTGTGVQAMDYLLADQVLVPSSERAALTERVVDLPNFLGYWTPEPLPEPGPLPALESGHVTFGSFNRLDKILHPVIHAWATILLALPAARLVLKDQILEDTGQRARITSAFETEGISGDRLTLLGASDRTSHFSAYQKIDIALDTFPHSGGMTTLDALWMGVPVVTWPGRTISSRLAAASLSALALTDFVAADAEIYVKLAVAKAGDLAALARLRAGLRAHIAGSVIGDPQHYARAVESVYREIWRRWCAGGEGRPRDHRKDRQRPTSGGIGDAREAVDLQSFSQHGQDTFVHNHFFGGRASRGTFVEIGAYDGISFSNSLFFERHLGWNGICIEPLPLVFDQLRRNRKVVCVNCAISDREGIEEFIDVDMPGYGKMYSGLLGSYDERHMELVRAEGTSVHVIRVRTRKLSDLLDENGLTRVDYLSIDTEGSELKILRSFDPNAYGIRVISIENNYRDAEIRDHLFKLGYQLVKIFGGFDELYAKPE